MTYAHALKYAGAKPFRPEHERDDIARDEMEQLEQDEIYQRLAECRFVADRLEADLCDAEEVPTEAWRHVFDAVANTEAPLSEAVDEYVDAWLADYRDVGEVSDAAD